MPHDDPVKGAEHAEGERDNEPCEGAFKFPHFIFHLLCGAGFHCREVWKLQGLLIPRVIIHCGHGDPVPVPGGDEAGDEAVIYRMGFPWL